MVADWAEQYIGLPFAEKGRSVERDGGLDCWGLFRKIYKEQLGIDVPSYAGEYNEISEKDNISRAILRETAEKWNKIDKDNAEIGDGIVLRILGDPIHVGVLVGDEMFIHIREGINAELGRYNRKRWNQRIRGFWRHKCRS